jgi:hypothetical protein
MEANPGPKMMSDAEYWAAQKVQKTSNTKQNFIVISVLICGYYFNDFSINKKVYFTCFKDCSSSKRQILLIYKEKLLLELQFPV